MICYRQLWRVCSEWPAGACEHSAGFHCRSGCQRIFLPSTSGITSYRLLLHAGWQRQSLHAISRKSAPKRSKISLEKLPNKLITHFISLETLQGHINLGKKGYNVPRSGTIQVTLLNPLGTVVKMFVVMYDLADMPGNSQTFLRQRTLYMPANPTGKQPDNAQKWLRYLIHLR